jgi:predicted metal-dependent phosphoesterase TrpH
MRIDLHCHSSYSHDNYLEPEALIEQSIKVNLNGVCFTEHNSLAASRPVERITVPAYFSVFGGIETSTDRGHILLYGSRDDS